MKGPQRGCDALLRTADLLLLPAGVTLIISASSRPWNRLTAKPIGTAWSACATREN